MKIGFGALQRISKMEEFMVDTRLALLSQHFDQTLGETPMAQSQSQNTISIYHPYFWAAFILVGDGK
jgi:CHAT domain-containing protein